MPTFPDPTPGGSTGQTSVGDPPPLLVETTDMRPASPSLPPTWSHILLADQYGMYMLIKVLPDVEHAEQMSALLKEVPCSGNSFIEEQSVQVGGGRSSFDGWD